MSLSIPIFKIKNNNKNNRWVAGAFLPGSPFKQQTLLPSHTKDHATDKSCSWSNLFIEPIIIQQKLTTQLNSKALLHLTFLSIAMDTSTSKRR